MAENLNNKGCNQEDLNKSNESNNNSTDSDIEGNAGEDCSITMLDVLEAERQLEDEYAAVLGASDEKCCTYSQGAVKRQALYSCLTCCPEARQNLDKCAGICLACSYHCHEKHELVELYTKRNFRCDCPTKRMNDNKNHCRLNTNFSKPVDINRDNVYNQNFQGLYCTCHRPYPDPERNDNEEDVMVQCAVCEDWYHLHHIEASSGAAALLEICAEMICNTCMEQKTFLKDYIGFALTKMDAVKENGEVEFGEKTEDNKLISDLDKSISDIMKMSDKTSSENSISSEEPPIKRIKISTDICNDKKESDNVQPMDTTTIKCSRPTVRNLTKIKGPTFWSNDWRLQLCRCDQCLKMYREEKVEYLLDMDDSAKSYEERGMRRAANECSTYERGIQELANIDHRQRIDAITAYNDMKDRLKEFLHSFAVDKKVVTEDDINRFFNKMRSERNNAAQQIAGLQQPHFCR